MLMFKTCTVLQHESGSRMHVHPQTCAAADAFDMHVRPDGLQVVRTSSTWHAGQAFSKNTHIK